ncbi:hypothetical protein [Ammoniphilus sp. CFH 90114]|uniref:hypothetical protein n=1 Tax=Ammoniphilus sp. CFH 90114 TaxID=2493665 RepID=UPI00100ED90A|nr:hypothetical protein [Ammoniphilus sp. CFH 90114]RXT14905.1 hypothetical protein EIZ39_01450 [Ammoniphilus sp. CFH 90114]
MLVCGDSFVVDNFQEIVERIKTQYTADDLRRAREGVRAVYQEKVEQLKSVISKDDRVNDCIKLELLMEISLLETIFKLGKEESSEVFFLQTKDQ